MKNETARNSRTWSRMLSAGADSCVQGGCARAKSKSARIFRRNSPSHQPRGGHHHSERPGDTTAKSIPGQCALKEYRNQNRTFTEGRD